MKIKFKATHLHSEINTEDDVLILGLSTGAEIPYFSCKTTSGEHPTT
jgi:hypothetical protein